MYVMMLPPVIHEAAVGMNLTLTQLADYEVFNQHFLESDWTLCLMASELACRAIKLQTAAAGAPVKYIGARNSDVEPSSDYVQRLVTGPGADEAISLLNEQTNRFKQLQACMVDSNTVILYADPAAASSRGTTLENIFCAMALIMPVDAVMKTDLYEHYVRYL